MGVKSAGHKRKRKVYLLDFEGTDLDGLVVRARSAPLGEFMRLGELADQIEDTEDIKAAMDAVRALVDLFDKVFVDWNLLDDDDQPVPANIEGLLTLEVDELMAIFLAWQSAVAAVPAPLSAASGAGEPSVARSMPMEIASPSQVA